jgi:hypothetical protein
MQVNQNTSFIPVNFKEVWGEGIKTYYLDPQWSTRQMLQNITPQIVSDFGTSNFELVLCGQNIPIMELGTPLPINDNTILKNDIFGPEMRIVSFYIRRIDFQYPQMDNLH